MISFTIVYSLLGRAKFWARTITALSRWQATRRTMFPFALPEPHRDQMRLFLSWKCVLPVIEEPHCDHFRAWSSWLNRMGVALFCTRSCRQPTESICSPRNKSHLMVLVCFYSMMQVHTDSLGMVRSLQYSGCSDVAMLVMASYTQWPYKISLVTTVSTLQLCTRLFSPGHWGNFVMWSSALGSCVSFRTDEYSPRNFFWTRVCRFIFDHNWQQSLPNGINRDIYFYISTLVSEYMWKRLLVRVITGSIWYSKLDVTTRTSYQLGWFVHIYEKKAQ